MISIIRGHREGGGLEEKESCTEINHTPEQKASNLLRKKKLKATAFL
jgi:hypothetical protein